MITDTAPFRYPHYHEATDTPDKLDYDRFALVVNGMEEVSGAEEIAGEEETEFLGQLRSQTEFGNEEGEEALRPLRLG